MQLPAATDAAQAAFQLQKPPRIPILLENTLHNQSRCHFSKSAQDSLALPEGDFVQGNKATSNACGRMSECAGQSQLALSQSWSFRSSSFRASR